jgi:hypothetical protein
MTRFSHTGILGLGFLAASAVWCSLLFAQSPERIKVLLANGNELTAVSVVAEEEHLKIQLEGGGTIWVPKSELSTYARSIFFGERMHASEITVREIKPEKTEMPLPKWDVPPRPSITASVEQVQMWVRWYLVGKTQNCVLSVLMPSDPNATSWYIRRYNVAGNDPNKLYLLVREHVTAAADLVKSHDAAMRRRGLGMALEAATRVMRTLKDSDLATAICDAYVLPYIKHADDRDSEPLSKENVLMGAIRIYHLSNDAERQAISYKLLIEHASDKNIAGMARMRLAEIQRKNGQFEDAVNNLKGIAPDSSMAGARKLIPQVEKEFEKQKKQQEKYE